MTSVCTICDAPWQPSCAEHPVQRWGTLGRPRISDHRAPRYTAEKPKITHQRRASDALAEAIAREPGAAERYGLEREP